jgi:CubicO group peptidase (beta-lactamase class C family)
MRVKTTLVACMMALAGPCAIAAPAPSLAATDPTPAMTDLLDYLHSHNTTGFLVVQDGKVLVEQNWPAPTGDPTFAAFVYERAADGGLLEDVASQQKSFVSVLVAVAIDKGLIDIQKPVSDYIGAGWSKATPDQEVGIRVIDVLTMHSGLTEKFTFEAPAGSKFFYNTPVYAITKRILVAAAKQPLETITHDWLTAPVGMADTAWRKRPPQLASVGNDTGLVTSPRDVAKFGLMILHGGVADSGKRIVSAAQFKAMFTPSATNPAYARLWWINSGAYAIRAVAGRKDGPLIAAAPTDTIAALGAFDRRLYVVPSRKLVVVRTGAATNDKDFDEQFWTRLDKIIR